GKDTWRCKECHGWDYQGAAGAYGSGSHYTGFAGVYASRDDAKAVFDQLNSGTDHDFGAVMDMDDILNLTAFITEELIDVSLYINLTTKASNGDATAGKVLYESTDASTGGGCITCHGADGTTLNFGTADDPEYLGGLANGNPWETLHKIRFGHPGSLMPSTVAKSLTVDDANDILAFAQSLPNVDMSAADAVAGGLLYDKWWVVTGAAEPTTDQALWSTQTGSNARTGKDTWRCKECHGWDYQGAAGENYDFGGLSALANGNPWETLHKIRFGHPGSVMPSTVAKSLTADDANDILAYAQTTLADLAAASAFAGAWKSDE
ncbi:MAG: hypothetical protein V3W14_00020, partial [Candidatus Neomarinimicrobiota bacterium]